MITYAREGYAFMRVLTPQVAREYEIPLRGRLTGLDRRHFEELEDLADKHHAPIEKNPYRTL